MDLKSIEIFNCITDITEEFQELMKKQHIEVEVLDKDRYFLNPNFELYLKLQTLGMLNITFAKDLGTLIGYYVTIIQPHTHHKHILTAYSDILYLKPVYRKQGLGKKLIEKTIEALKLKKVSLLMFSVKTEGEYLQVPKNLGFKPLDTTYYKEI